MSISHKYTYEPPPSDSSVLSQGTRLSSLFFFFLIILKATGILSTVPDTLLHSPYTVTYLILIQINEVVLLPASPFIDDKTMAQRGGTTYPESCRSVEKLNFMLRKAVPPNLLYNIIQQHFLKTLQVPDTEEYGDQNQIFFLCVCVELTQ